MLLNKQINKMSDEIAHINKIANETMAFLRAEKAKNVTLTQEKEMAIQNANETMAFLKAERAKNKGN